jgi:hypothetical protein
MTKQIKSVIYGVGGFDASKLENNVIEIVYHTKEEVAEIAEAEAKETVKAALLTKLGITAEEAKLLLG